MKKSVGITAGVVVVAVAGWLGTTWYTGTRIQEEEPSRLVQLNQELAAALGGTGFGAAVSQISYDRHFFTSQVRYGIKITKMPGDEPLPEQMLEVVGQIEHGPFPKSALRRGHWVPKLAFIHTEIAPNDLTKPVFDLTKGVSPLTSDVVFSYNGDGEGTAAIAPFDFAKGENSLKFSGAQIEGSFERQTRRIVGWAKSEQVSLNVREDELVKAEVKGLFMDVNSYAGISGIDIGTSTAKIDNITVDIQALDASAAIPGSANKVVMKDLSYAVKIGENGPTLNAQADYKLGQIFVNSSDFGKFNATLRVDNINGKAAKALSDIYNKVLTEIYTEKANSASSEALMLEGVNQFSQLLAAKPTLRVDPFVWETPKGQSNLTLAVDLTKPAGLVVGQAPTDYEKLLQETIKLIDLKASVSKPMAQGLIAQYLQQAGTETAAAEQEATEQVDMLGSMAEMFGVAKVEGDKLLGSFRYADGKAELNGEEIPADGLFSSLLGGLGSSYGDDDSDQDNNSNTLLSSLDPAVISNIFDEAGYEYELDTSGHTPVLNVDATEDGARSFEIFFNDCEDDTSCGDMLVRATVSTPRAVPIAVFNEWNQDNRLIRAYRDTDSKIAVLEMDVNAFGGIGQGNVEYVLNTFIAYVPLFAETMKGAPAK